MNFAAAAIQYNFHMPSAIRFAGKNYTAEYRDIEDTLKKINHIIPHENFLEGERVFKVGSPNILIAESSKENFMTYWRSCRWREFWHKKEIERLNSSDPNDPKFKVLPKEPGLRTDLSPVNLKTKGPKGSAELEKFLSVLEMELLENARKEGEPTTAKDAELKSFFEKLNEVRD
eukprot:1128122-Ditylum_brightwellii.AAC.1